MRRRLTFAIVGVVAGALVVAGLGSLLLVRRADAGQTRTQLVAQAQAIAAQADEAVRPATLSLLKTTARLYSAGLVGIRPDGALLNPAALPAGVTAADLVPRELLQQQTVSAVRGSLAYAAAPIQLSAADLARAQASTQRAAKSLAREAALGVVFVVVVTRQVPGPAGGGAYFAVAAAVALLVAALVADRLGRRITRPLAGMEEAARRIADGDLDSRIDVGDDDYPELASLGHSFNTMTEGLARAQGLERQFLMSVSHDLRTPLTSIRGWAEAIADGAAEDTRAAAIIGAEAARLQRLVQDLLDLAKLDARSFSLHPVTVDLVPLVAAMAESFRPSTDDAGLHLTLDLPEGPVPALADPDRLSQVVANLIENAYKYARRDLRVWVASAPGSAVVAVEDDGPGIPAADLDHVFERLYQVEHSPARPAGSGLGLTIVKELTTAMNGQVRVESPTGRDGGTRVVVTLPAGAPEPGWP
ncbi:MAG TPA: HAMP domain-containing sensor histidine kinase [Acidimicrobiales bacterium]|nr:HAMP domain-containing sensor histidine kinase [Acidimicrobiales bacterium]